MTDVDLVRRWGSVHSRRMFEVLQDHRNPCYLCGDEDTEPERFWHGLTLYREMEMKKYGVYWNPDLRL